MAGMLTLDNEELEALPRAMTSRMMWVQARAFDEMIRQGRFVPATVADIFGIMHGCKVARHPVTGGLYRFVWVNEKDWLGQ